MKYPYRKLVTNSNSLSIAFDKDKLKEVSSSQSAVSHLEVIKNGNIGSSSITGTHESGLWERAQNSAEFGDKVAYLYGAQKKYPKVKLYHPTISRLTPEQLLVTSRKIIADIKRLDPNILVSVRCSVGTSQSTLENSSGMKEADISSFMSVYIEGELITEGDFLTIGDFLASREPKLDWQSLVATILERFKNSQKMRQIKSGNYPVIFASEVVSSLVDIIDVALSAETVVKKVSRLAGHEGKQVFDSRITLIDDPGIDFAVGSTRFDDEGLGANPLVLIEKGKLKNFYTDLKNASKLHIAPNGRGFGFPASPSLTNIVWEQGTSSLTKLIKGIKKGILVDQVVGAGQDSPYSGDFSFNVHLGFLIENGAIVGRIKNALVAGNAFDLCKNQLGDLSSERKWVGSALVPNVLFEDVVVTAG